MTNKSSVQNFTHDGLFFSDILWYFNEKKNATEFAFYFSLRDNGFTLINEDGEVDVAGQLRADLDVEGRRDINDDLVLSAVSKMIHVDLADLIITVDYQSKDPLLHTVGGGRLLPRDFARKHLKALVGAGAKVKWAEDTKFKSEDWFPKDD